MPRPRIVLSALLLSLLVSGCQAPGPVRDIDWPAWWPFHTPETAPNQTAAPTNGMAAPDAARPDERPLLFVSWPVSPQEVEFLTTQLADFAQSQPGAPIEFVMAADYDRRVQTPAADTIPAELPADLYLVTGFALPTLIASNLLGPVPAQYDRLDTVAPRLAPGFGVGTRAFCLPRDVHTLALAYNPELFDRVQAPYPTADWGWEEFAAAAAAITDQDFFIFALTLNPDLSRIAPFLLQAGGGWVDPATGRANFDAPATRAGLDFFIEQFREGYAVYDTTLDSIWPGEGFGRGSAGMTIEGSWLVPFLAQEFPRFVYATAELPRGPVQRATLAFTTCLGVNPNSPHRERALELAAHLTRPDIAADWRAHHGGMPVVPDEIAAWQSVDPLRAPFAAGVEYAQVWQLPLGWESIPDEITPSIRSAIADDITVETLAERLQTATQNPE
ncbi:MAG: extracellular solute-binding protein [Litorilinea sp.]